MVARIPKAGKHCSPLSAAIPNTVAGLRRIGRMDKETMHEFDASFLTAVEPLIAKEIAAICKRAGVREGVRAHYHPNVKPKLASAWARRETSPSLKLPFLVQTKGLDPTT